MHARLDFDQFSIWQGFTLAHRCRSSHLGHVGWRIGVQMKQEAARRAAG
jgi:hypothetical protein